MDFRTQVVLGKFAQVTRSVRIPKALFLSYFSKATLIQLNWSGPLRAWTKLEGFPGEIVEKNS